MAHVVRSRRVHCKIRHIDAIAIDWSDGRTTVKCVFRKYCGECPFESSTKNKHGET